MVKLNSHPWAFDLPFDDQQEQPYLRDVATKPTWSYTPSILYLNDGASLDDWVSSHAYAVGDLVHSTTNNEFYRCLVAHTSSSTWSPHSTVGKQYWAPFLPPTGYMSSLQCVTMRGQAVPQDMDFYVSAADYHPWYKAQGTWAQVMPQRYPQHKYAWCVAVVDGYSQLTLLSASARGLATHFDFGRYAPPINQVGPSMTRFLLFPLPTGSDNWMIELPWGSSNYAKNYPLLYRTPAGVYFSTHDYVVDEWQQGGMAETSNEAGAVWESLSVETLAGHLIIHSSRCSEPWIYYDPAHPVDFGTGTMQIRAYGHALAISAQQIRYPAEGYCIQREQINAPTYICADHYFTHQYSAPTGTTTTAYSAETGLTTSSVNPDRTVVKLTSDTIRRPCVYNASVWYAPEFSSGRSDPKDYTDLGIVREITGHCDDTWRNATCDIRLRVPISSDVPGWSEEEKPGYWTGGSGFDPLQNLAANSKVVVSAGWQVTSGTNITEDASLQFTGYLTDTVRSRQVDEQGYVEMRLSCRDLVGARLAGKHFMFQHACYAGLPVRACFDRFMNICGVPNALIDTSRMDDINFPVADRQGLLLFKFSPDYEACSAMDDLMKSIGHVWGVACSGVVGGWKRSWAMTGEPDFTLSDTTITEADYLRTVDASRSDMDYRNYILAIVGQGSYQERMIVRDTNAHSNPSGTDFIGDAWWDIESVPDQHPNKAAMIAYLAAKERWQHRQMIRWSTQGKHDLWPDQWVRVAVDGLEVTNGTVFRITDKSWRLEPDTGLYITDFIGVREYEG